MELKRFYLLLLCFVCCYAIPSLIDLPEDSYSKEMFWGSYRPGIYFGMKTRSESPIMTGFMWSSVYNPMEIRHQCRHEDDMSSFGWSIHNGRDFGQHEALDNKLNTKLTTSFLKDTPDINGGSWVNRITAEKLQDANYDGISSFYYIIFPKECNLESVSGKKKGMDNVLIQGECPGIENFSFMIKREHISSPESDNAKSKVLKKYHFMGLNLDDENSWDIQDRVKNTLISSYQGEYSKLTKQNQANNENRRFKIIPLLPNTIEDKSNVFIFQMISDIPFTTEVLFMNHKSLTGSNEIPLTKMAAFENLLTGSKLTERIEERIEDFNIRFDKTFHLLEAQGLDKSVIPCAQKALSNMVGSIGYWYGESLIFQGQGNAPMEVEPQSLFSGCPARSFFPRGFLWDEGFHQILISEWDLDISMDIIRHWLNLMDITGWIPREQILGSEARSRVPPEFQPQHRDHANPPAFFLSIDKLLRKYHRTLKKEMMDTLVFKDDVVTVSEEERTNSAIQSNPILSKLHSFFKEIYPRLDFWNSWMLESQSGVETNLFRWRGRTKDHTLTSGLDDFPRAPYPSDVEAHVDLLSWMALSSRVLSQLSATIGNNDAANHNEKYHHLLQGLEQHWDSKRNLYSDIMNITNSNDKYSPHIGYVTMFPIMMGLIPDDSPRLLLLLEHIKDESQMWSSYGLRSLSKSDEYYQKGENYWRGPIWINMNYLFLSSLKLNYFQGPYEKEIRQTYSILRENLVRNVVDQFRVTGYLWEQYHEENGNGARSHPFTGWTALIVNIMSELY